MGVPFFDVMESNSRMVHWVVWSGLAVVIIAICFAFVREQRSVSSPTADSGLSKQSKKAAGEVFLAENKSRQGVVTTDSGLQYKTIKVGDGPFPVATDTVTLNYKGTLLDGTEFDNGNGISFPLNGVIKGWEEGLQLMRVGGSTRFFIPSDLAYSASGLQDIGANSMLIFDIDLLSLNKLPVISQLSDFSLTNQLDQPVRLAKYADKVWFADIVFTRCAGPCPTMTKRMAELQAHFIDKPNVAFATLTTDPEFDTPKVMKRFAKRHKAQDENWDFLTGPKSEIVRLAVDEMKLIAREKPEGEQVTPEDLFIHSSYFVVIDQQGRLRGVLESLDEGWKEKAVNLATRLLKE